MKKQNLCIFTLSFLVASAAHGATVYIKNNTYEPVWARINDQLRRERTEKEHKMGPLYAVLTFGISIAERPKFPHFKKITPGTSTFFDSGLKSIKKITFLRIKRYKTVTIPPERLEETINPINEKYGNLHTIVNPYYIRYYDGFKDKKTVFFNRERDLRIPETVTIKIPEFETFTFKPDIAPLKVEARINYDGWGNAKRVN